MPARIPNSEFKGRAEVAPPSALRTPHSEFEPLRLPPSAFKGRGEVVPHSALRIPNSAFKGRGEVVPHSASRIPNSAFQRLAHCLRPFGITPRAMRIDGHCVKGYSLSDFTDAFSRFLDAQS